MIIRYAATVSAELNTSYLLIHLLINLFLPTLENLVVQENPILLYEASVYLSL